MLEHFLLVRLSALFGVIFTQLNPFLTSVSSMKVPRSLMIAIVLLALGFLLSLAGAIRTREKEGVQYQMVSSAAGAGPTSPSGGTKDNSLPASYQNSSVSNYAIPPQQKVNTYCVIDSRLVDS